ncbi:hypothetical protein WN51_01949 [Melipona quadrifasciata]|uniref:Uncharacterized protein n=1 Tax=Melipona quadrifasciata TaxID=166423 RepID=A0A0N0BKJ4_9HYME|nr:hypothetical protein WN51_01949 [Melipona quadrifasciata]
MYYALQYTIELRLYELIGETNGTKKRLKLWMHNGDATIFTKYLIDFSVDNVTEIGTKLALTCRFYLRFYLPKLPDELASLGELIQCIGIKFLVKFTGKMDQGLSIFLVGSVGIGPVNLGQAVATLRVVKYSERRGDPEGFQPIREKPKAVEDDRRSAGREAGAPWVVYRPRIQEQEAERERRGSAIAQTTPLLLEVYSTPPHESRDPNRPIANFRCISVAPEEVRFSGLPSLKEMQLRKRGKLKGEHGAGYDLIVPAVRTSLMLAADTIIGAKSDRVTSYRLLQSRLFRKWRFK